jgi:hypothetical protein
MVITVPPEIDPNLGETLLTIGVLASLFVYLTAPLTV